MSGDKNRFSRFQKERIAELKVGLVLFNDLLKNYGKSN